MGLAGRYRSAVSAVAAVVPLCRFRLWIGAGFLCVAVAACSPIFRDHGYVPDDTALIEVEVGRDTRETVAEKVGRPSASGLLNDVGWFYVQSRWRHYGARAPQEIDRQVVAITFNEAGVVQNVERFGQERGRVVTLSRRVTENNIRSVSFLRQLMGSIGRLRAADLVD